MNIKPTGFINPDAVLCLIEEWEEKRRNEQSKKLGREFRFKKSQPTWNSSGSRMWKVAKQYFLDQATLIDGKDVWQDKFITLNS